MPQEALHSGNLFLNLNAEDGNAVAAAAAVVHCLMPECLLPERAVDLPEQCHNILPHSQQGHLGKGLNLCSEESETLSQDLRIEFETKGLAHTCAAHVATANLNLHELVAEARLVASISPLSEQDGLQNEQMQMGGKTYLEEDQ